MAYEVKEVRVPVLNLTAEMVNSKVIYDMKRQHHFTRTAESFTA